MLFRISTGDEHAVQGAFPPLEERATKGIIHKATADILKPGNFSSKALRNEILWRNFQFVFVCLAIKLDRLEQFYVFVDLNSAINCCSNFMLF